KRRAVAARRPSPVADITSGRTRRMLSVGRLTTSVGGSYLWQAIQRPFQSASRHERTLLETHIRNAQRVVARSKELRGAFMKLAQMLSMRSDLLPAEALEVLSVVQSSVPPMPWARIRRVLAAELGAPPEERFRRFEREAFAAASLGQVHRAELARGQRVAVKVQYPGVAATVQQDLKNVKALLRVFTAMARDLARQDVDTGEVAAELEARLREELDYLNEAANLERFRRLLADDDAGIAAACAALGFIGPHDDPGPMVKIMHVACEPLERDLRFDPRDYDLLARGAQMAEIALAHRIFRAPGHRVFLLRALVGLDAYLKAFGTVRNWHRLFREIV